MRAAPLKGDCIICQAPEPVRIAVNAAIWPDGPVRAVDYRAAGARAAKQAAEAMGDESGRYADVNVKTITRHADHIEASWREINPGERIAADEVPLATDFGSVMEQGSRLGVKAMAALEQVIDSNPLAFAAFRTKEAISIAKLGVVASGTRETSRLKRNQQAIDVVAIFGLGSGHVSRRRAPDEVDADAVELEDLRSEVAEARRLLAG